MPCGANPALDTVGQHRHGYRRDTRISDLVGTIHPPFGVAAPTGDDLGCGVTEMPSASPAFDASPLRSSAPQGAQPGIEAPDAHALICRWPCEQDVFY